MLYQESSLSSAWLSAKQSLLLFSLSDFRELFYRDLIQQEPVSFTGFIRNETHLRLLGFEAETSLTVVGEKRASMAVLEKIGYIRFNIQH